MTEQPTTTTTAQPFSLGAWIGGFLAALFVGAIGNVIAVVGGISSGNAFVAGACGIGPGLIFVLMGWSLKQQSPSFAGGLIVGGCAIALVGGACGAAMSGATFH